MGYVDRRSCLAVLAFGLLPLGLNSCSHFFDKFRSAPPSVEFGEVSHRDVEMARLFSGSKDLQTRSLHEPPSGSWRTALRQKQLPRF